MTEISRIIITNGPNWGVLALIVLILWKVLDRLVDNFIIAQVKSDQFIKECTSELKLIKNNCACCHDDLIEAVKLNVGKSDEIVSAIWDAAETIVSKNQEVLVAVGKEADRVIQSTNRRESSSFGGS